MRPPDLSLAEWRAVLDLYVRKLAHGRRSGLAFPSEVASWEAIIIHVRMLIAELEQREAAERPHAA
jgi:hypothetical protein